MKKPALQWQSDIAAATAAYCRAYKQQREHERIASFMKEQCQADEGKITRRVQQMLLPRITAILRRQPTPRRVWLERHYTTTIVNHITMTTAPYVRLWLSAKCSQVDMTATLHDQAAVDHLCRRIEAAVQALAAHPVD
jgi:hypothetical protein